MKLEGKRLIVLLTVQEARETFHLKKGPGDSELKKAGG